MGFLDGILGGSSEPQEQAPWGPQSDQLKNIYGEAESLYGQGPQQYYPGQTVAGANPNMQNYFGGMGDYSQGGVGSGEFMQNQGRQLAGGMDQSQGFYNEAMGNYFNPYASAKYNQQISDSVNNNPVLNSQIQQGQQDINRNMQENILPSIAGGAVATGNTGSTRRGVAEGVAMRGAMEQGSDMATNMRSNAYNQGINQANNWASGEQFGQNRMFDAANMMNQQGQFGSNQMAQGYGVGSQAYQDLLGAGMYERGVEQEGMNAERERFDFEQNAPWQNLNNYYNIVGSGNWGGTSAGGGPSSGNQLMQMGTQLGGAYLMGQSDRRLKTNIQKVGEVDGLNVYTWDWNEIGIPLVGLQPSKGFIYDEVPDNMKFLSLSGYGMVDYSSYPQVIH
jgi:hypothetical protein